MEMTLWRDVKACILKGNAVSFPKITCQICLHSEITITGLHPPDLIASILADERKTLAVLPCGHKIKPFFVHGAMEVGRGSRSNEQKIDMVARHMIPLTTTERRASAFVHLSGHAGLAHQLTCEHCFREKSAITCEEDAVEVNRVLAGWLQGCSNRDEFMTDEQYSPWTLFRSLEELVRGFPWQRDDWSVPELDFKISLATGTSYNVPRTIHRQGFDWWPVN